MNKTGGDAVGDPIPSSNEELLKKQGDTRPDPDEKTSVAGDTKPDPDDKELKSRNLELKVDDGDVPG
ncbi:MAG: hypothetical protein AYK18_17355 [Theionarchaea archaeon DG-70]|nr:MAG: hypothetical protein AYK18_17355 [Theionarchaea archaeon DG-70]